MIDGSYRGVVRAAAVISFGVEEAGVGPIAFSASSMDRLADWASDSAFTAVATREMFAGCGTVDGRDWKPLLLRMAAGDGALDKSVCVEVCFNDRDSIDGARLCIICV